MSGAITPLPNTPSWRGAQLKHRDNFTFTPNPKELTVLICSVILLSKNVLLIIIL
jgi:hypothetical protein